MGLLKGRCNDPTDDEYVPHGNDSGRARRVSRSVDTFTALAEHPDALAAVVAESVRVSRVTELRAAIANADRVAAKLERHRQSGEPAALIIEYVRCLERVKVCAAAIVAEDEEG